MNREEFREQMKRCPACGQLCDGDVCDDRCAAMLDSIEEGDRRAAEEEDEPTGSEVRETPDV